MKKITSKFPQYRAVLKSSIASFTLICASTLVQADTISTKIDLGEPFPFKMEDGVEYEVDLDIGYQFDSIDNACISTEVKGGNASKAFLELESEPATGSFILGYSESHEIGMIYSFDFPTQENPNPVSELISFGFCAGRFNGSLLKRNFLDGEGKFTVSVSGGYVEFWDFKLVVEGDLSDIQLAIELDEPADFSVPSYGGRVNYDASIRNLDSSRSLVTLEQWSVLTLPNGDKYPIHKSRDVVLNYSEAKDYTRNYLTIPEWFEAGDYELTWYVADPSTGIRVKDSLHFTKSAD
ncbi:RbmA family biofilm matrix protein [Microbulbifer sp. PSTR4-B]|uniref:RbmA family biofilm matrix protein n=1 Tax=Microbulbifer sp. PSTR4-B TaxID=3243396 RepID=UPI0040394313